MKYISRLTALLLAMMMIVSDASALTVNDLTQGTMDALYQSAAEDTYVYQDAGVLGEWIDLNPFAADTNMENCTFLWYDESGNQQTATEDPQILRAIYTQEEQRYYCVATDGDGNSYKSDIYVLPAAQMTDMEAYVGFMATQTFDDDTGLYDSQKVYDLLMNTWNVPLGETTLAANVVAEWWTNWSESDLYYDMICSCVVSGAVESDDCVLYPGSSQHAEGCEWAGDVIVPEIPQPELYYGNPQGKQYTASASYTLPLDGERAVILPESGRAMINANAADGAQWQVSDGVQWIDITGENSASLTITTAKLNTIFELTGVAELRYFNKDSETVLASVSVTSEEIANGEYVEPAAEQFALFAVERAETDKHTIVINYLFSDGNEIVTSPYTATIEKGGTFKQSVPNPIVRGYKLADTNATNVPTGFTYTADAVTIDVSGIDADMTMNVYYVPTEVTYTVIHYAQNYADDNYTEAARETMTGLTKSLVAEVALDSEHRTEPNNTGFDPTGFYSLLYEQAAIAADGSTIVEVYYDRNYYLLSFDLGGGYGVEPIYARFGTPVGTVATPTRAGYTFGGWSLDGKTKVDLPATVPADKVKYIALWVPAESHYTVVYWLQNANPDKNADGNIVKDDDGNPVYGYSVWGSKTVSEDETTGNRIMTGDIVSGSDDIDGAGLTLESDVKERSVFSHADTDVVVKGDGTTIVNVYYNRNEYTLKFYYAMSSGSGATTKYYVIGGSTYYFGTLAEIDDKTDDILLLNQYMGGKENATGMRGEVTPTEAGFLKASAASRYIQGTESGAATTVNGTKYTYYYIAFKAKYGADLSELWPIDVFNPVNTDENTAAPDWWKGTAASVSAWNGEYNVWYTQNNEDNQTIKGKFSELDYQLLWENGEPDDMTVSYLCFWENGADIGWSIPELYIYRVWVPVLENQNTEGLILSDDKQYYLADQYNTVDDSEPKYQTAPSINGLTHDKTDPKRLVSFDTVNHNGHQNNEWWQSVVCGACGEYHKSSYVETPTRLDDEGNAWILRADTDNDGAGDEDGDLLYADAYEMNFYYKRNNYTLTYVNEGETLSSKLYPFEADISGTAPDMDLPENYPDHSLEKGGYKWEGWYTHSECLPGTEFNLEGTIMPANNITLYAKWVPVTHNVYFYQTKDDLTNNEQLADGALTKTVSHGATLTEDQVPGSGTNGGLTFIGWFYEDAGVEKAIDFENMPINHDLHVYGKWSSNTLKKYTVYFKLKDTGTEIADPITGSSLAGMTKTFDAKGGEELKPEYREGYFPEVKSHSLTLSIDDANNTGANTFTFWYVPKVAVPYIVRYWVQEADGTTKMQEQVLHSDNKKAVVTETFKVFTGYMPDAYQKRLVISEEALGEGEEWIKVDGVSVHPDNVINFYYKKDEVNAYYKVSHWLEPLTGSNWTEYGTGTQAQGKINITQLKAEDFDLALDGYTFDVARTECIYGGDETRKKVVGNGSVTLPQEGLELKLYYVRNEYPYEVRHVELNTGVMLEQTEKGKAKYGDTKSGAPKTIPGYTYKQVNPQEGQISIRVEKSDTVKLNIITYYYVENDVEIKYVGVAPNGTTFDVCGTLSADAETVKVMSGTALGSTAAAKLPAFKFVGWYDKDKKLLSTEARYVPGKTAKISVYDAATDTYVEKDAYESATYYAKFEWKLADLSITKTVVEQVGFKAPEGTEFAFAVKLTGVLPSNTISVSIGDTTTQTEKSMTLDENNVLAFSLKDGQTAVIHDLPVGTEYEVEETVPFNYTVRYDGNETGAIPENGVETLVTNHYPLRYGELTVTKAGLSKDNESAIVDVVITTNKVKTTYTLVLNKDNPSATIAKIQVGSTYTVTERTGWTWLYSDGPAYDKAAGTIGDEPTTCTITNHSYSDQWMHDESYLVNNFGTGSNAGVNK